VLAALGFFYLRPGLRFWSAQDPWIEHTTLSDVAAASAYAAASPGSPIVFVVYPPAASAQAWGLSKQSMNITLGGLPGEQAARAFFYVGAPEDFLADRATTTGHSLFDRISAGFLRDADAGLVAFDRPPVVLRLASFNEGAPAAQTGSLVEVAPNVSVVKGSRAAPLSTAGQAVVDQAHRTTAAALAHAPRVPGDVG